MSAWQLKVGSVAIECPSILIYQSLYSVPSNPVPCALVNTSKAFCRPQGV